MTFVDPQQPRPVPRPAGVRLSAAQVRELTAVALILVGMLGIGVTATVWHPLVGAAVWSIEALITGVVLGLDRG